MKDVYKFMTGSNGMRNLRTQGTWHPKPSGMSRNQQQQFGHEIHRDSLSLIMIFFESRESRTL